MAVVPEYESACEVIHPSAGLSSLVCNPQEILDTYFSWARTTQDSEIVNHFKKVAAELKVVSLTCGWSVTFCWLVAEHC